VFATIAEYIGKEADRWEEDSHFGADEDSAIAYGVSPEDRARLIDAIRHAVRVEKLGVKRLAKRARLADRAVSRAVAGDSELTDDEIVGLSRSAEDLLARKRAEDGQVDSVLDWARAQPRSWLAAELGYDQSNLSKVIAGGSGRSGSLNAYADCSTAVQSRGKTARGPLGSQSLMGPSALWRQPDFSRTRRRATWARPERSNTRIYAEQAHH
jgi:hypothetical protein